MKGATPSFSNLAWRWHFYAGLFVVAFLILLSLTGIIYRFKPSLDALCYFEQLQAVARQLYGELMLGTAGGYLIEPAAGCGIVLVASGLHLCCPRAVLAPGCCCRACSRAEP